MPFIYFILAKHLVVGHPTAFIFLFQNKGVNVNSLIKDKGTPDQ